MSSFFWRYRSQQAGNSGQRIALSSNPIHLSDSETHRIGESRARLLRVALVGLACAVYSITAASNAVAAASAYQEGVSELQGGSVAAAEHITQALMAQQGKFEKSQGLDKASQRDRLLALAEKRHALLSDLMESDPSEVFRVAIPNDRRTGMPDEVQTLLLHDVEVEGELEVRYEDYQDGSSSLRHLVKSPFGESIEIYFGGETPQVLTGAFVSVQGLMLNPVDASKTIGKLVTTEESTATAECCSETTSSEMPPAGAYTLGEQRTLVMLVNFQDKTDQPWSTTQAQEVIFGSTNDFFIENSGGQTWLTGDVVGWYTLPLSHSVCDEDSIAYYANAAAEASGVILDSYERVIYAFPQNACSWQGLGNLGGMKSKAWLNNSLNSRTAGHELGHNLGLGHSMGLECGDYINEGSCSDSGYGNRIDIMGSPNGGHFNAFQKDRLGWLGNDIQTVTASGSYSLLPYAGSDSGTYALKIWQGIDVGSGEDQWYYLEFRRAVGLDSFIATSSYVDANNVQNGVIVNKGIPANWNSSRMLDMTPASSASPFYDFIDPALIVGQQFYDPAAGITISTTSSDATQASVQITLGQSSCVPGVPDIAVTPGTSPWVGAGSAVTFTVTITNSDDIACGTRWFDLKSTKPTGWSATFADDVLNIAAGDSGSTTLTVTSPTSAVDGFYDIQVTGSGVEYSSSAVVAYVVDNPESVNVSPVAMGDSATTDEDVPVTIAVLSNDSDPDGDSLSISSLSGVNGSTIINPDNTITFTPPPGFTGIELFSYTLSDGNGGSASAQVSVTVNPVANENRSPVAEDDVAETSKNISVTIAVLDNDYDPDGDVLSIFAVSQPGRGSVSINSNGTLTYVPARKFKDNDSFSYTITDGEFTMSAVVNISLASSTGDSDTGSGQNGGGKGKGRNN